ncbi:hypothetical protein MKX03_032863 [Papaver bracteatum]|nr:hypothetical protein MKX03_032863 [Papaver bracteatum]
MNLSVREFIKKEVPDWDDEVVATARFKALSGQRSDWESKLLFWKKLDSESCPTSEYLRRSLIRGCIFFRFGLNSCFSLVRNIWFNRQGLTPLCIDQVLLEMYSSGDILRKSDLMDPTAGPLSQMFKRMVNLIGISGPSSSEELIEEFLILSIPLQERAAEVVKLLSESHWTSFCTVTMSELQKICNGSTEASTVLSYLSSTGKARYLSICKEDFIEGVKVSLVKEAVPTISSLDYDVLQLIWTKEKLQQQLDVIDQRYEMSRKSALNFMKAGNKQVALRHARQLKLNSESREKCTSMLNRVEEVLTIITSAESTKKVVEAIQIGSRAMKESGISAEEVHVCLQDLDDTVASQKEVEEALASAPIQCTDIDDEDLEKEFRMLEMELEDLTPQKYTAAPTQNDLLKKEESKISETKIADSGRIGEAVPRESAESLVSKLSNLQLEAA